MGGRKSASCNVSPLDIVARCRIFRTADAVRNQRSLAFMILTFNLVALLNVLVAAGGYGQHFPKRAVVP